MLSLMAQGLYLKICLPRCFGGPLLRRSFMTVEGLQIIDGVLFMGICTYMYVCVYAYIYIYLCIAYRLPDGSLEGPLFGVGRGVKV